MGLSTQRGDRPIDFGVPDWVWRSGMGPSRSHPSFASQMRSAPVQMAKQPPVARLTPEADRTDADGGRGEASVGHRRRREGQERRGARRGASGDGLRGRCWREALKEPRRLYHAAGVRRVVPLDNPRPTRAESGSHGRSDGRHRLSGMMTMLFCP